MDTAMPQEKLREIFDRITRKVTQDSIGIRLVEGSSGPAEDICTVHIGFHQGFHSSLSLRADRGLLTRLTQSILHAEQVTAQDMEDVTKEYFNVLCGHIAKAMYHATKVASRFSVPAFHPGKYTPEGQKEQFALHYADEHSNAMQLVHHIPDRSGAAQGVPPITYRK